jgi:integrase/recombinase XerC
MSIDNTTMLAAVQRYLDERRGLGFKLRCGSELLRFARYADARGHRGPLTLDLQLDWAQDRVLDCGPATWHRRLKVLRPFSKHYRQFEPESVVPDAFTFGPGHQRLAPHIYFEYEIVALLQAASQLTPAGGLRPVTYQTLFGLLASTGMRVSEARNLQADDVDLRNGWLVIRQTKYRKSRRLPLHASVVQALREYEIIRDCTVPRTAGMAFFLSQAGTPLTQSIVNHTFGLLRRKLAWVPRGGHPMPRIHDLRHTFAVRRVQRWHEDGTTMDQCLFWLCTYLGHTKISDTYWYLTGTPELMEQVGIKFERFALGKEVSHA